MNNTDEDWWGSIRDAEEQEDPTAWQLGLVFADWLEEQGRELESVQLRFAVQVTSWYHRPSTGRPWPIRTIKEGYWITGRNSSDARDRELLWARQHGVQFVRFFPLSEDEIEDALKPIQMPVRRSPPVALFQGGPKNGQHSAIADGDVPYINFPYSPPVRPQIVREGPSGFIERPPIYNFQYKRSHYDELNDVIIFNYEGVTQ